MKNKISHSLGQLRIRSIRLLRRRDKTKLYIGLGILLLLTPVVLISLFKPNSSEASWWNSEWSFRKEVPISNTSGSNQDDFQILITLDTELLITDYKLRSDCADLRITDYGGSMLPFWVEPDTCDTTETKIWVKADVPSTGTSLYIYYGNPVAPATGQVPSDVFIREMDSAVVAWPLDETESTQSYARAIHPEVEEGRNIVINGTFDSDTSWTKGTGWTISGDLANAENVSSSDLLFQTIPLIVGKTYEVTYTISNYSSGSLLVNVGSSTIGSIRSANGTYTETLTASGSLYVGFRPPSGNNFTGSIDNVSVKQVNIPSSGDFTGTELLTDGDMEAADTSAWIIDNGATGSKETSDPQEGIRYLRLNSSNTSGQARQAILTPGKTYYATGYTRSDGTAVPQIYVGNSLSSRPTSTTWSAFAILMIASDDQLKLRCSVSSGTGSCEFDDISVTEVSPLVGKNTNGVVPGTSSDGHLSTAYTFDGTNDNVNIYSSDLNSVFNPDEGTIVAWAKVSDAGVWTDGNTRQILSFGAGNDNWLQIRKSSGNNTLSYTYVADGVSKSINASSVSNADWIQVIITWNTTEDRVKAYLNGNQVGISSGGLGVWSENLLTARIGTNSSGLQPWKGQINDVRLYNRALTAEEISAQYNASYDTQNYYTENYPGKELVRKYNDDVSVATLGTEEIGLSPILNWTLNDGNGTTTRDSSTNTNHGTLEGDTLPTWQAAENCVSETCLYFDGQSSKVTGSKTARDVKSISFWINPSVVADQGILDLDGGTHTISTDENGQIVADGFDDPTFYVNGQVSNIPYLVSNVWTHITITTATDFDTSSSFTLGTDGTNFFEGYIDEVQFYNYERSASQAKVGYNSAAIVVGGGSPNHLNRGLVAHWPLDDTDPNQSYARVVNPSLAEGRNIVINGGFDSDTVWGKGSAWTIANGVAHADGSGASGLFQTNITTAGKSYSVTFTISNYVSGGVTPLVGNSGIGTVRTANGTFTETVVASGNSTFYLQTTSTFIGDIDNVSVKQVNIPSSASISSENLLVDGDMEAADTSAWTNNGATLTKSTTSPHGGSRSIRVAWLSSANPNAAQTILTTGKTYRISGWFRGDGAGNSVVPRVLTSVGQVIATGTNSNTWQYFDSTFIADNSTLIFRPQNASSASYVEFDDITVTEVSPLVGKSKNGVTPGVASGGHLGTAYSFDGTNDAVDIYSSDLNSAFNPDEGTLSVWAKVSSASDWTDGSRRFAAILGADGTSNYITIRKYNSDNVIHGIYYAGGIQKAVSINTNSTDWMNVVITWSKSKDEVKVYSNGIQSGSTETGLGTWSGNLSGSLTSISTSWSGLINDVRLYNRALSPSEIQDLYNYAPGPVAHWKFDEGTGTSAYDSSGNGNTGIINGANWENGRFGNAINMTGPTQYVTVPDHDDLDFIQEHTVSFWMNPADADNAYRMIRKGNPYSTGGQGYSIMYRGDTSDYLNLQIDDTNETCISAGANYILGDVSNTWTHISLVFSKSSSSVKYYVNGSLVNTATLSCTGDFNSPLDLQIGSNVSGFNGQIDDVRIYNYARSQAQIIEDMNANTAALGGTGAALPDPVAYYSFDEQSGQTVHNSSILDTSNQLNGTLGANSSSGSDDPTWKTNKDCKVNGCLSFDNIDDYVNLGNPTALQISGNITISAWVNSTSDLSADRLIVGNWKSASRGNYGLFWRAQPSGAQGLTMIGGQRSAYVPLASGNVYGDGQWHHISGVLSDNFVRLYVDGHLVASNTFSSNSIQNISDSWVIGDGSSWSGLGGLVDEVKIYNTALTQEQVLQDYNAGAALNFGTGAESEASLLSDGAGDPPVAHWTFDEKTGTTAADKSGNNNNGTINGATWKNIGDCKVSNCLSFDGEDDRITMLSSTLRFGNNDDYTISGWINLDTLNTDQVITAKRSVAGGTGSVGYVTWINSNNKISHEVWDGNKLYTITSSTVLSTGQWYHYSIVWDDDNEVKIYINGQQDNATEGGNGTLLEIGDYSSGQVFTVGSTSNGSSKFFKGKIDDIKVYDYARTPSQIMYDYNRGAPVAHWKFDECSGTTVYDASGNGNNGTITSGTTGTNTSVGNCEGDAGSMWADGKLGKWGASLEFDGTNDYVTVSGSEALSPTTAITLSAWIYPTQFSGNRAIISKYDGSTSDDDSYHMRLQGATPYLYLFYESGGGSPSALNRSCPDLSETNTWYHLVYTWNGSSIRCYINGNLVSSGVGFSSTIYSNVSEPVAIGSTPVGHERFEGQIDDVRIYNYALSADQVKNVYNNGAAVLFSE